MKKVTIAFYEQLYLPSDYRLLEPLLLSLRLKDSQHYTFSCISSNRPVYSSAVLSCRNAVFYPASYTLDEVL